MRELKCRAWDKDGKKMLYPGKDFNAVPVVKQPLATKDGGLVCNFDALLFTGLKDKNGKEIYEGDILHWRGSPLPMKVEWDRRTASFCATPVRGGFVAFSMKGAHSEKEHSIIGNIYENPELLETLSHK